MSTGRTPHARRERISWSRRWRRWRHKHLFEVLDTFSRRKVALVSASESLNTESAAGRMVVRLLAVVSEWEREAIGERTRDALTAKRRRGERYSRHLPYGTQLDTNGSTLLPHADEIDALRFIAECRAEAGLTWSATADALNREGYRTRAGGPWTWHNARKAHQTAERRAHA